MKRIFIIITMFYSSCLFAISKDDCCEIINSSNGIKDFIAIRESDVNIKYLKVEKMVSELFQDKSLLEGILSEERLYSLFESYISLIEKNKYIEAKSVREEIIHIDPHNLQKSFFRLAMIDFENLAKNNDIYDPGEVVLPIIEYIKNYGKKDRENLWRLEILISQFLSSKGEIKKALLHARASYKAAPTMIKKELVQTILELKRKLQQSESVAEHRKIKD